MPVLHPAEIWKRSGRYDVDVVFKLQATAPSATSCSRSRTRRSSRCTPRRRSAAIATCRRSGTTSRLKERDEPRPSGGVLRTREFTMKDSYTLDRDQAGLDARLRAARGGLRPHLPALRPRLLQGRVRHRDHGRQHGARVHGAVERGRGSRRALQQLRLRRQRRDGASRASSAAPFPPSAPVGRGRDARRDDDRGAGRVPRHRPAHDRQGDAGRRRRRQASGSRSCAATAACTSSSWARRCGRRTRAGDARGDRGRVRRQARLDRAGRHPRRRDRRHRRRRDAARGLLGDRRQPHGLAPHRRRGRPRLRGRRSPTSTRSRTATAARSATAC